MPTQFRVGGLVQEASTDREEILVGEVRTRWPFLRDRRIDACAGIDQRFLDGD
jgi:hypothetical protein